MDYNIQHNESQNRFETTIDGFVAVIEYEINGDIFSITHTRVPKELEGKGIAAALTKFLLEHARNNNFKVRPVCTYAIAYLNKHTEYSDIQE